MMPPTAEPKRIAAAIAIVGFATGCTGTFHSTTGDIMSSYAVEHMMPSMMTTDDVGMACETGVSMGAFLVSFGRVTDEPRRAGTIAFLTAAFCAKEAGWEAELAQLRAARQQRAEEALDSRIAEKRAHQAAASRFYTAFKYLEGEFGRVGEGCPEIEAEDELIYLLGLTSGLLAVLHDRNAEGIVGVSMEIPPAVARASECLDNDKWWGVPQALRAAIWTSVPGATPEGVDPWQVLKDAAARGDRAGVRLAGSFEALAAAAAGRDDVLRGAVARFGSASETVEIDPSYRLLDTMAAQIVRFESDKIWTRKKGHRTPLGALGTFPESEDAADEDDSLLDGLGDEEEPASSTQDPSPET